MKVRSIIILLAIFIALGGYFYFSNRPAPPVKQDPQQFAWMIEMDDITHINISLPHEGKQESFIKIPNADQFPWHFDDAQQSPVDTQRWGGGIPLLLSGPGVERIISENTSDDLLREYGILDPSMEVKLTMVDGYEMDIKVGDHTPDGRGYYVLAPHTRDVATVDSSWYQIIERLITQPPYAPPDQ